MVISAFPGTSKSYYFKNHPDNITVMDSDSSTFDKANFPNNYIEHIKEYKDKVDILFVSSHKEVRDALVKNNIYFSLVYPRKELLTEYIMRFVERDNNKKFIRLLYDNWSQWLDELEDQEKCDHYILSYGDFMSRAIREIERENGEIM